MSDNYSFAKDKINILLLEGIHRSASEYFKNQGYSSVQCLNTALDGDALKEAIKTAHFIGIRSRTQLKPEIIDAAERLLAVGCFCIGTNQVDLDYCQKKGLPVFNAPHSNTRSVAELVIAEMIMLTRGLGDKNTSTHAGTWNKKAVGSYEVRGKTVGIIGYGHIGSQVSVIAEAIGMRVVFFDVAPKLAIGNAQKMNTIDEVLACSDFITLHVPEAKDTETMIGKNEIQKMKKGAALINASRGRVVDLDALADAIKEEHVSGAAIDVFPKEPASADERFESPLQGLKNVILTPHIGGSTTEAQVNIGTEVASKLVQYSDQGTTEGAVNFPSISLPAQNRGHHRLLHIHKNQPGVLGQINQILSESKANILGQYLQTLPDVGYVVIDVDKDYGPNMQKSLAEVDGTIRCRILY